MVKTSSQKAHESVKSASAKDTAKSGSLFSKYIDYKKHYNYAKSAALATILAVVFLGFAIAFFALWQGDQSQITSLR